MSITIAPLSQPRWLRELVWPAMAPTTDVAPGTSRTNISPLVFDPPVANTSTTILATVNTGSQGGAAGNVGALPGVQGVLWTGASPGGGGIPLLAPWTAAYGALTCPTHPLHRFYWLEAALAWGDPTDSGSGLVLQQGGTTSELAGTGWLAGASEAPAFGIIGGPAGVRVAGWLGAGIVAEEALGVLDTDPHVYELRVTNRAPGRPDFGVEAWVDGALAAVLPSAAVGTAYAGSRYRHWPCLRTSDVPAGSLHGNVRIRQGDLTALGLPLSE